MNTERLCNEGLSENRWNNSEDVSIEALKVDQEQTSVSDQISISIESPKNLSTNTLQALDLNVGDSLDDSLLPDGPLINNLLARINHQQQIINSETEKVKLLENKCFKFTEHQKELESRLEAATKQKETALKDKENMVIRYAVSEQKLLKEQQLRNQADSKCRDFQKECEHLQHKLQTMANEKNRICLLLDNKFYECKNIQQQLDLTKQELSEIKMKYNKTNHVKVDSKIENDSQRECHDDPIEYSENSINQYQVDETVVRTSIQVEESRLTNLEKQLKEQQAKVILLRHEKINQEQNIEKLKSELEQWQKKFVDLTNENQNLTVKLQQLDQQCQEERVISGQVHQLEFSNQELAVDMEYCRSRESELLAFTQQLTEKNVRLLSEFSAFETKIQQLTCEVSALKRHLKEQQSKTEYFSTQLHKEQMMHSVENGEFSKNLMKTKAELEEALQQIADLKEETVVTTRKYELRLREVTKELEHYRKKFEQFENNQLISKCTFNSNLSLEISNNSSSNQSPISNSDEINLGKTIDTQALIEHIVKLQRISAKKSEKIDFLEDHIRTLTIEIQKKSRLL